MLIRTLALLILASASTLPAAPPTTRPVAARASAFDNVPLDSVLDTLRDAGLNLAINWPAIEAVGIDRAAPVTLKLRGANLRTLLTYALRQAGNGQLSWYVADGVVHVTTRELADRAVVTRVYPVGDLLVVVPDFKVPSVTLQTQSSPTGGGGSSLFGGGGDTTNLESNAGSMAARGERLCELIRTLVRPEVWVENGGVASVRYFAGNLIVTAPRDVQNLIGR